MLLSEADLAGGPSPQSAEHRYLGRLGNQVVRLAHNSEDVCAAQQVRYQVFCEELSAEADASEEMQRREFDRHDQHCEHLVIEERQQTGESRIVGTQRFYLRDPVQPVGRFYSQSEFDVEGLAARYSGRVFMELGRSCILPEFRSKRTLELMWQGTWAFVVENRVDVMIGCASFQARDMAEIAEPLAFLARHASVDGDWSVEATGKQRIEIDSALDEEYDDRKALRQLPPLIKGYLRLGAMFSRQAVADPQFGTIDVLVVLPVERISKRYINHYGEDASRHRG